VDRDALKTLLRELLSPHLLTRAAVPGPRGAAVVTEAEVLRARGAGGSLRLPANAIVTPLARETAERLSIRLELEAAPPPGPPPRPVEPAQAAASDDAPPGKDRASPPRRIAIAADHGGVALKALLVRFLRDEGGYEVQDLGTDGEQPVDYPDFAHKVAGLVQRGEADRGIMIDGMGIGSTMACNRHRGVRAALGAGILEVVNAREHNDANVLCLGGRTTGELAARAMTLVFLTTAFGGGRHASRVAGIEGAA
jgi:ribose 5-phosphate isomerase B